MTENDIYTYAFTFVLISGIAFAVYYYVTRFAHSIDRQLWNQQQIITLLLMIAREKGINPEALNEIEELNNKKKHEVMQQDEQK
jgi:hypothetical protein